MIELAARRLSRVRWIRYVRISAGPRRSGDLRNGRRSDRPGRHTHAACSASGCNLHIFDHTTAKRAHGQLPCEMNCATWRPVTVSRSSCPTRVRLRTLNSRCECSIQRYRNEWNNEVKITESPRSGLVQRRLNDLRPTPHAAAPYATTMHHQQPWPRVAAHPIPDRLNAPATTPQ
jgi:hypothetical protein